MKKVCPECGNNLVAAYRKIVFCNDDITNCATIPVLTYVCKECGFSATPKSTASRILEMKIMGELQ